MVNTFLVTANFRESARKLDRARLGKQRVEAYQILNNILDLYHFSERLEHPLPEDQSLWKEWIRTVVRAYQQWDYCYVYFKNVRVTVAKSSIPAGRKFEAPFRKVSFGFVYHTATLMWLGWPDALKAYINAHIDEWVERGYENTMRKYWLPDDYEMPPWVDDPLFHDTQKAALLAKEITRNEPKWYTKWDDFHKAYKIAQVKLKKKFPDKSKRPPYDYFWPSPDAWRISEDD